ncbi:MarC family protein [candidate division KSB1 bacterium]|nr:MarC family protein [candidate division KSB1 bacterium]
MAILSAAFVLFLVLDPLGNIPLFLVALKEVDPARHKRIIIRESLFGLGFLVLFLFLGRYILQLMQISQSSLSIAGGIILLMIAIKMVFHGSEEIFKTSNMGEPFIVPLAIPLISGPSAMTTVVLFMAREPDKWLQWLIAVILAWLVSATILFFSNGLSRILRKRGLIALERLMGMLLTTVAVEMFIKGVQNLF